MAQPLTGRLKATVGAVAYVARQPELLPLGMAIGPFSFMTKLVADPIAPVFMAGTGVTGAEDPEVKLVEDALELATRVVLRSIRAQVAKAIILCEPAANCVYFSPNQLATGADTFDRYVLQNLRRIRALLAELDADLVLHDCGELTNEMVQQFGQLDPAILSLGSSRVLWDDAGLLPKNVVLFGNLPTKKFYSDDLLPPAEVERLAQELLQRMQATGHPFILGSECDVLSVPGAEKSIRAKVDLFLARR